MIYKQLIKWIRFSFIGLLNTLIHLIIVFIFMNAGFMELWWQEVDSILANCIAYTIATLFSYLANTLWTFSAKINFITLSRFIVVAIIGFLIVLLLSFLSKKIGLSSLITTFFIVLIMPLVNFGLHSFWTFKNGKFH